MDSDAISQHHHGTIGANTIALNINQIIFIHGIQILIMV